MFRQVHAIRASMSAIEQAFYDEVTTQVRDYCGRYEIGEGFLLTIPQRQMCSSMPAACRSWQRRVAASGVPRSEDQATEELLAEAFADLDAMGAGEDASDRRPTMAPLVTELARIAGSVGDYDALRKADGKYAALLDR
ncbi:MAG: hypothetical protein WCJ49_07305, partial [Deltaproteobacteria bacterium]